MGKRKVYFRADGNEKIGLGHVYRCFALAEQIADLFEVSFIIQSPTIFIETEIKKKGYSLISIPSTKDYNTEAIRILENIESNSVIVLDGYNFLTEVQKIYKVAGLKVVMIDDLCEGHYYADVILNHSVGVSPEQYSSEFYTKFNLGTQYSLLRTPFVEASKQHREINKVENLFINLGGADPDNHTLTMIEMALKSPGLKRVNVVLGASYLHKPSLGKFKQNLKVEFYSSLSGEELCDLMKVSDAAICSSSTISYEYCSVGGLLFVIKTADNQKYLYDFLISKKLAYPIEKFIEIQNLNVVEILNNQQSYFDGKSSIRLRSMFESFSIEDQLEIRPVNKDDMLTLFNWSNDPEVRANSINKEPVVLESHERWFNAKLLSSDSVYYIANIDNKEIGLVRFDNYKEYWLISFLVDKIYRGKGLGEQMLHKAMLRLIQDKKVDKIKAQVQVGNTASNNIFIKLGFIKNGFELINNDKYNNYYKIVNK